MKTKIIIEPQPAYFERKSDLSGRHILSRSGAVNILKTPLHFVTKTRETAAMNFGTLAHAYILDPTQFAIDYQPEPTVDGKRADKRTKEGKAAWEKIGDAKTYSADDLVALDAIKKLFFAHYNENGYQTEFTIVSGDDWPFDIGAQCRIDYKCLGRIVDLKTTSDASANAFTRSILSYGYDIQAYLYSLLSFFATGEVSQFDFFAVETSAPYHRAVYTAGDDVISYGEQRYAAAIDLYRDLLRNPEIANQSYRNQVLRLPKWANDDLPM